MSAGVCTVRDGVYGDMLDVYCVTFVGYTTLSARLSLILLPLTSTAVVLNVVKILDVVPPPISRLSF